MFERKFFVFLLLAAFDYSVVFFSLACGFFTRYLFETEFNIGVAILFFSDKIWFYVVFSTFFVFLFYLRGLYRKRIGFWDETKEIVRIGFISLVIFFFATAIFKLEYELSRFALFFGVGLAVFLVPASKLLLKKKLYKAGIWVEKVVIVGENKKASELFEKFAVDSYLGYTVIGFVTSVAKFCMSDTAQTRIAKTVVVCDNMSGKELMNLQKLAKNVILAPNIEGVAVLNTEFTYSFDERTFFLAIKNNLKSETNIFLKRALDLLISLLILPFVLIVIIVVAIAIRIDSTGKAIFVQKRLGMDEKEFFVYKFRSMYLDADRILEQHLAANEEARNEWNVYKKLKSADPRVTRLGKLIRKLSLDELPQIFNVLKGEMSIVGPRPYLPSESDDMGDKKEYILEAKPGITGLWQVSGRNELTFEERLSMDVWYVLNWSVWLDVVILLKTVKVVLKKSGAY
jgi:undecaprenyl-phosphate galactose phosphotransferase